MPRKPRPHPVTLVRDWPHIESADPGVEVARQLAVNLDVAMQGRSARTVGTLCAIDYSTVSAILNGTTWPDLRTIAALESGLGTDLWPAGVARTTRN